VNFVHELATLADKLIGTETNCIKGSNFGLSSNHNPVDLNLWISDVCMCACNSVSICVH